MKVYSPKKSNLGIELTASALPPARILKTGGSYILQSHLQSSYDLGVNYRRNLRNDISISTGLHYIVGKRNFFWDAPNADVTAFTSDGRKIIEAKDLWGSLRIPMLIEKKLARNKKQPAFLRIGMNLRYSGLNFDTESYGGSVVDSNNNYTSIYSGEFSGTNGYKPWITFLAGGGKTFTLNNHNKIAVCLQADISFTYFFKGNYEITIPGKPVSTGIYKISGTSLGLSVQYVFTGSNKQMVMAKRKYHEPDSIKISKAALRKISLEKFVFKGNNIRFSFARMSIFKANLSPETGTYPATTKAAPGLLLSIKYQANLNNRHSLIFGPEATLSGRNFVTSFSKNDFSPPLVSDYNLTANNSLTQELILSLPVTVERRWLYSKTKFVFTEMGLKLNFSLGADADGFSIYLPSSGGSYYNAGGVDVVANNDAKPWVSFPINAGHSWLLKNNNLLQFAICSNISSTKYVNGTYQIIVPGRTTTTGTYSSTGSFIGLSLNYVFTSANYRIRKAYEKKRD